MVTVIALLVLAAVHGAVLAAGAGRGGSGPRITSADDPAFAPPVDLAEHRLRRMAHPSTLRSEASNGLDASAMGCAHRTEVR